MVVRAIYGLSVAVFGFALCDVVFEILLIFGKIAHCLKSESFCQKIDNISNTIMAKVNPKTATESS